MSTSTPNQLLQGALALHRMGNLRAAMEGYVQVLRADPENADALYYVAVVALQEGNAADCIKVGERALSIGPPRGRLYNLLGQAHFRMGEPQKAIASYDRAIEIEPDLADAYGNRANVLGMHGFQIEALADYDRALALRNGSYEDWSNRGAVLQDLDRIPEALASFERALSLRPDFAGGHYNRANALRDLAQLADARAAAESATTDLASFDAAEAAYNKAIELNPQLSEAFLGRGILRLLRGNWETGWSDYDHRSRVGKTTYTALPDPTWRGEALDGQRLVLVSEQGLGDTLLMCRFAPLLAARGIDVTILTHAAMRPLLSTLPDVTIAANADELAADKRPLRWIPLMSVPGVLGVTPDTIPAASPYLVAEPTRVAAWSARLKNSGFKIGINWSTGHPNDGRRRDIPLADFAPLVALPGVRLISLQKGKAVSEIDQVPFRDRVEIIDADLDPSANFFLDTAAAMMSLDLVVTCDTSVTHLAGALARPVFTALPAIADWRWLLTRDDSPWYPTLKLFRQRELNQWPDVMERIAQAARVMIASAPAR